MGGGWLSVAWHEGTKEVREQKSGEQRGGERLAVRPDGRRNGEDARRQSEKPPRRAERVPRTMQMERVLPSTCATSREYPGDNARDASSSDLPPDSA